MNISGTVRTVQERLREDVMFRWTAIVAAVLLLLTIVFIVLFGAQMARANAFASELVAQKTEAADLQQANDSLAADVAKYQPVYLQSQRVQNKENVLKSREASIDDQQAEIDSRQAEVDAANERLAARETEVKAREDRAAANLNAGDWWVGQVRECLARSASNRVATVTEGSLIGRDTTCYTQ